MASRAVTPSAGAGCPSGGHPARESRGAAEVGVHHHQAGAGVHRIKGVVIGDTLHYQAGAGTATSGVSPTYTPTAPRTRRGSHAMLERDSERPDRLTFYC